MAFYDSDMMGFEILDDGSNKTLEGDDVFILLPS